MNESGFILSIMRALPKEIYKWKIHNMYQNGVADCYFSGIAGDIWIEFKYKKAPKKETTLIKADLSALQIKWLTERYNEGRNVAVIYGTDIGAYIYRGKLIGQPVPRSVFKTTKKKIIEWIIEQTLG